MAGVAGATTAKSRIKKKRFLCGVPDKNCIGSYTSFNHMMKNCTKSHGTSIEAFKCHAGYLLSLGYTQVGNREFAAPDNGPIRVLTKKTRFGAMVRGGKESRYMGRNQFTGGTITSM